MSVVYQSLAHFWRGRGITPDLEDSYDYGVWWRNRSGGIFRLTWVGTRHRDDPAAAGELYLLRLGGVRLPMTTLERTRTFAPPHGAVELLCVVPPVPGKTPDENVEAILDGWADVCGQPASVDWIYDRVAEAVQAGWATVPKEVPNA